MPYLWSVFMFLHTALTRRAGLIRKPTYAQCSTAPSSQSCIWSPLARHRWSVRKRRLGAGRRQSSRRHSSAHRTGSGRSNAVQFCQLSAGPWTTHLPQQGGAEWWSCWSDARGCLQKWLSVVIDGVNGMILGVTACSLNHYCFQLVRIWIIVLFS